MRRKIRGKVGLDVPNVIIDEYIRLARREAEEYEKPHEIVETAVIDAIWIHNEKNEVQDEEAIRRHVRRAARRRDRRMTKTELLFSFLRSVYRWITR